MTTKYKNSPLIETICEFHYIHKDQWDATLPGMLYENVKTEFPNKNQRKDFFQPRGNDDVNNLVAFTQFLSEDKLSLLQIGKNVLTINCLKPYPHWEKFKPMILKNSKIYNKIGKPDSLRTLSLRYINKIYIPVKKGEIAMMKEYFHYYPQRPEGLSDNTLSMVDTIVQIPHNNNRDALVLRLATVLQEDENFIPFLLQLDFLMMQPEALPIDKVEEWLEDAHAKINTTFELCITDKCRELFK